VADRGDIWVGDLATAIDTLQPCEEQLKKTIAGLLGFYWRGQRTDVQHSSPADSRKTSKAKKCLQPEDPQFKRPPDPGPKAQPSTEKSRNLTNLLTPVSDVEILIEADLDRPWELEEPLGQVEPKHLEADPPYEPLLDPRWNREILAAAAAAQGAGRRVDIKRLVEKVAKGRPIDTIPVMARRTLARGVQLLIDQGIAMEPFRRDQEEFAAALKAVVGESRVEELIFADCPTRGCFDPQRLEEKKYPPPQPGTPVLVLSDLGIGGPGLHRERASLTEWTEMATTLNRLHCSLVAFLPYPEHRWQQALRKIITHIPWDRSTSIRKVLELSK